MSGRPPECLQDRLFARNSHRTQHVLIVALNARISYSDRMQSKISKGEKCLKQRLEEVQVFKSPFLKKKKKKSPFLIESHRAY